MEETASKKKEKNTVIIIIAKIIIWFLPLVLIFWILSQYFSLSGTFEVSYSVQDESPFFSNFASKEQDRLIGTTDVNGRKESYQLITTSPLYFGVTVPRLFPDATVTVTYQNPQNQPELNLGVLQPNGQYYIQEMAHYSRELEEILNDPYGEWNIVQEKDTMLFQRGDAQFDRIDDFLASDYSKKDTASFNYPLKINMALPDYQVKKEATVFKKSIRGAHLLYAYIGENERMSVDFTVQDINRHYGEDIYSVTVFAFVDNVVQKFSIPDDGNVDPNGVVGSEQRLAIDISDLPQGVYRIEIDANDDLFTKQIATTQNKLMFASQIYLTDNAEYRDIVGDGLFRPTVLYTDSSTVSALTSHDAGLQTLTIGHEQLSVDTRHTFIKSEGLQGITKVLSPKNDILITGDGNFSFSKDQLFDMSFDRIPSLEDLNSLDGFSYIIAHYSPTIIKGGWLTASQKASVPQLYYNDENKVQFIVTMPGLPEEERALKVKEVTVLFEKEPITIRKIFSKIKSRITGG